MSIRRRTVGTWSRLDALQAAVLLGKFPHLPAEIEARGRIGARYTELLRGTCVVAEVAPATRMCTAQYAVRLPERNRAPERLKEKGISDRRLLSQEPARVAGVCVLPVPIGRLPCGGADLVRNPQPADVSLSDGSRSGCGCGGSQGRRLDREELNARAQGPHSRGEQSRYDPRATDCAAGSGVSSSRSRQRSTPGDSSL